MENVLSMIVNAENVRMLLVVVFGWSGFVLINSRMGRMEASIKELKYNDFAHLNSSIINLGGAIQALTYALEKNGTLSKEDKEYVDSRLAH